jgi:hypothetical protein
LCVSTSVCVWKIHSACRNNTLHVETAVCIYKSHSCVLKSHFAFRNYTRAECGINTYECHNHTHTCQHHTVRVEITLVCVEIRVVSVVLTFVRVKITLCNIPPLETRNNLNMTYWINTSTWKYTSDLLPILVILKIHEKCMTCCILRKTRIKEILI